MPRSALEAALVGGEFGAVGERAVDEEVGDLLELGGLGDVEDVVAAVVEVVAGVAHGAEGGVAGDDAGEGDGFLGHVLLRVGGALPLLLRVGGGSAFCSA